MRAHLLAHPRVLSVRVCVQVVALVAGGVLVGAMTAGLGLVAPMVIVGVTAAAGGGATAYGVRRNHHEEEEEAIGRQAGTSRQAGWL